MSLPHEPEPTDDTPFDADGALLGFSLPWEAAPEAKELPAVTLPEWLQPAPKPETHAKKPPSKVGAGDGFDLDSFLELPKSALKPEPTLPEPIAAPPADFAMPWETTTPDAPPEIAAFLNAIPQAIEPEPVADLPEVPELADEELDGQDLLTELLAVHPDDVVSTHKSGWAEADEDAIVASTGAEDQYIVVQLAGTEYGVELPGIVEIGKRPKTASLPHVPEWIIGLTNLRGDIVSVVDLRLYFGFPNVSTSDERLIVLRNAEGITAGLLVDGIRGLRRVPASATRLPIHGLDSPLTPYLKQLIDTNDRLLPVLDLPRLLAADEFTLAAIPA